MSGAEPPLRLRTERLRLKPLRPSHLPALHAHWRDPDVRRFLWDGRVVGEEEVEEVIRTSARLFDEHRAGLWAVVGSGRRVGGGDSHRVAPAEVEGAGLLGCAGFWYFHQPPELELLLSLSPEWWGRGLARDVAGALLEYAFEELGWPAVQASADAPNEASLRLMRALGMRPAGERPGEIGVIEVFRITASEWRESLRRPPKRKRPRGSGSSDPAR